jgi:hypothetical protein
MPPLLEANPIVATSKAVSSKQTCQADFKGNPPSLATDSTQRSVVVRRRIQLLEKAKRPMAASHFGRRRWRPARRSMR